MATATFDRRTSAARRAPWLAAAVVVAVLSAAIAAALAPAHRSSSHGPFAWLQPGAAPARWKSAAIGSGATLAFPPGWHQIESDAGTISAAPRTASGPFEGYLNVTPQSGPETVANWTRFRAAHLADEGARDIRQSAGMSRLRFRSGTGSCIVATYATSTANFREISCIVAGAKSTNVIVAAAPTGRWAHEAPVLERAISSFAD